MAARLIGVQLQPELPFLTFWFCYGSFEPQKASLLTPNWEISSTVPKRSVEAGSVWSGRGGSRIFFRRGCARLFLYFNTNKPHSFFFFFFLQNTSCIRKPQIVSGGVRTPCTLPLDPPLSGLKQPNISHACRDTEAFKKIPLFIIC